MNSQEKTLQEGGKSGLKEPTVSKFVIASEILRNRKHLSLFMNLVIKTPNLTELARTTNTPLTTTYKFVKKLLDMNIVQRLRGINKRKVYYGLTNEGTQIVEYLREIISRHEFVEKDDRHHVYRTSYDKFRIIASELGVDNETLAKFMNARKTERTEKTGIYSKEPVYEWEIRK